MLLCLLGYAALAGAAAGIELTLSLAGPICLWSALARAMEQTGLTAWLCRALRPGLRRLFPACAADAEGFSSLCGNLAANLLGLGNAATPAGVRADLTDPATWTKLDYPLQKSGMYNGEWQLGTGHGMWSHDEGGNLIYVFHNAEYDNGRYGGRDAQVRRVHWSGEGMPPAIMAAGNAFLEEAGASERFANFTGTDFDELASKASSGTPVLVWTTLDFEDPYFDEPLEANSFYDLEHCVVLLGVEGHRACIMDPTQGYVTVNYGWFKYLYEQCGSMALAIA